MSEKIPLIVVNQTNNNLQVSGYYGSDLSGVQTGTQIPPKGAQVVGYFTTPDGAADHYDWVYIHDATDNYDYQIYVEINNFIVTPPSLFAFFGWKNTDSSQGSGNPSPFNDGAAMTNFLYGTNGKAFQTPEPSYPVYILNSVPTNPPSQTQTPAA
jgi:hypothetical protein